jgi:hypothetical protein
VAYWNTASHLPKYVASGRLVAVSPCCVLHVLEGMIVLVEQGFMVRTDLRCVYYLELASGMSRMLSKRRWLGLWRASKVHGRKWSAEPDCRIPL